MKSVLMIAALAATGLAGQALAQSSPHLSAGFDACLGRAGSNTVQRNVCAQRESGAQDDRLNKAYQRVMRQLASNPSAKLALRDRQRRWIAERDYTCKINGDTVDSGCVVTKTAVRADELESQIRF